MKDVPLAERWGERKDLDLATGSDEAKNIIIMTSIFTMSIANAIAITSTITSTNHLVDYHHHEHCRHRR